MDQSKVTLPLVEDRVSVPSENEDQRILKQALMRLGPNGENWHGGYGPSQYCQHAPTYAEYWHYTYCATGALRLAINGDLNGTVFSHSAVRFVSAALTAFGFVAPSRKHLALYNDTEGRTFSEVRAMFELAIELAGQSITA